MGAEGNVMSEVYLSSIDTEDFRTFGEFSVAVPATPGLLLLTGTNGLGKSSFFDAIEWALSRDRTRRSAGTSASRGLG